MTGPEHYRTAEQLLDWAANSEPGGETERYRLSAAQVHATLALAAATALTAGDDDYHADYHAVQAGMTEWRTVAGDQTPAEEQRERMGGQP